MELEDMKALWQQVDKKLEDQKSTNERLFKYLIKEKSKKPLNTISVLEYSNVIGSVIIFILMLFAIPYLGSTISIIACYVFLMLALVITTYLSIKNIQLLKSIDVGNSPVNIVMERTEKFKLITKRLQMAYVLLGPLFLGTAFTVAYKVMLDVNVFADMGKHLPRLGIGLVAYTITLVAIYQQSYFKNLKVIQNSIKELEEFNG